MSAKAGADGAQRGSQAGLDCARLLVRSLKTRPAWLTSTVVALLLLGGCAGKKKDPAKDPVPTSGESTTPNSLATAPAGAGQSGLRPIAVDARRCPTTGMQVQQNDLDRDGSADLLSVFATDGGDGKRLVCRQADLNRDGAPDAFFHYGEGGSVEREQYDHDYDGRIDIGRTFAGGVLVLSELDLDSNGVTDTWRHYDAGRLVRVEHDRDGDHRADMFVFYVSGEIDRVGYDTDGDGKAESWDHDAARRARLALSKRRSKWKSASGEADQAAGYVDEPAKKDGAAPQNDTESKKPKGKASKSSKAAKSGKDGTTGAGAQSKAGASEGSASSTEKSDAGDANAKKADAGNAQGAPPPAEIKKPKTNP